MLQLRGVECSALHPQAIAAGIECRTENSVRPTPHYGDLITETKWMVGRRPIRSTIKDRYRCRNRNRSRNGYCIVYLAPIYVVYSGGEATRSHRQSGSFFFLFFFLPFFAFPFPVWPVRACGWTGMPTKRETRGSAVIARPAHLHMYVHIYVWPMFACS